MPGEDYVPVFQRTRGGIVESVHFGAAAIVDAHGSLLGAVGNPETVTYLRSSAKPFQALPFIENGGPEYFHFTEKETALICASHSGTDDHASTAAHIQATAGFSEADLQCGVHKPTDADTRRRMEAAGQEATPNRHNCSGKHSGMLAYARMMNWPLDTYLETDHPLQQQILKALAEMSDLPTDQIVIGIDGCSAPNFAVPLYNAALAYGRLADPCMLGDRRADACRSVTHAMMAHPEMIAGPGEFDTVLMQAAGGRLFAKGGAEGYQGIGILPGALGADAPGVGIALKISDGSAYSPARSAFALEILRQLGLNLPAESLSDFKPVYSLKNHRKIEVGTASPCFTIYR